MGKLLISLLVAIAASTASAKPYLQYASNYGYNLGDPQNSQHHAQDDIGQYNYGYSNPTSAKHEFKTADGIVRGTYSYVDANNVHQTVNYVADGLGFRVAATNLPVGPAEAVLAPQPVVQAVEVVPQFKEVTQHQVPVHQVQVQPQPTILNAVQPTVNLAAAPSAPHYSYAVPYAPTYYYAAQPAPVTLVGPPAPVALPVAQVKSEDVSLDIRGQEQQQVVDAAAPAQIFSVPIQSQYHIQDEAGQYQFGYSDPNANRAETRTADGAVSGNYNYVDANGETQTVNYIADEAGFRVSGTTVQVAQYAAPAPVEDLPEVKAAREEHMRLVAEVRARDAAAAEEEAAEAAQPIVSVPATIHQEPEVYVQPQPVQQVVVQQQPQAYVQPQVYVQPQHVVVQQQPQTYVQPQQHVVVQQQPQVYVQAQPHHVPVVSAAAPPPAPLNQQFHSQDDIGQYSYGYSNGDSQKSETKTADGIVTGTYSYVDANGVVQHVNYISDALGFRVSATNLPIHNVPVAGAAEAVEIAAPVEVKEEAPASLDIRGQDPSDVVYHNQQQPHHVVVAPAVVPQVQVQQQPQQYVPYYAPYAPTYGYYSAPTVTSQVHATQHHAQDEMGAYNYGYANPNSAKHEVKTADGVVSGTYSYVDANNIVQTTNYVSDAGGFRVAATNLPVGPPSAVPVPVQEKVQSVPATLDIRGVNPEDF